MIAYIDIPIEARRVLREVFTPAGACQWWVARNRILGGERPEDVWPTKSGPEKVLQLLEWMAEGNA